EGNINDQVFAQIGYTKYRPKNFEYKELIGYDEMDYLIKKGNVIITHGGPGSIFHSLQYGKVPIVVPRNPEFDEHVDEHQVLFTKRLEENKRVVGIYDIKDLGDCIKRYNELVKECSTNESNSENFIEKFDLLIKEKLNCRSK
ncbi:MAG: glycosyltransferase, partial [Romboutsia timonensis]|uniref:glycosyltransferase n=1 Tax=Romboutsia timonensis TaxID=1776391 RepID=UPI002A750F18